MTKAATPANAYRPPKDILGVFWTLADGTDEQRTTGTIKLARFIKESKDDEKEHLVTYCRDRLVKGLSSGRKFARVGFAVALTQLLHEQHLQTNDVVTAIQEKLKVQRHEKSSKSEVGGIFLGRAFGFSSIVQSDRLSMMNGNSLAHMTDELLSMADKKSYLKAVCNKTLEDITSKVSLDEFSEHVWPKLRDKMKQGWETCSLDTLSLLLACRNKFPDVVKKKFLKKFWGFPILSEENDEKLLKSILDTPQRTEVLLEKIVPHFAKEGRDILSVWSGIGEKLLEQLPEKKANMMAQRHLLGVKVASRLLIGAPAQQALEVVFSPKMVRIIFHNITVKNDPLAAAADQLFEQTFGQLKSDKGADPPDILNLAEKLWMLEASLAEEQYKSWARVDIMNSTNYMKLLDLLSKEDMERYADMLIDMVKGKDKLNVMSERSGRRIKQVESCLRQLQHLVTSPTLASSQTIQTRSLVLLLRLAYFKVNKKVKSIQHCESCINFEEDNATRKMCESLLFKSLNSISTQNTGHLKKSSKDLHFLELLFSLCSYIQELLSNDSIEPIKEWSEMMQAEWDKVYKIVCNRRKTQSSESEIRDLNAAFYLLLMYLSLQIFTDFKTASELLQDVYVCYKKAILEKKKNVDDTEEPAWVEVLTEVLLHLMSLPSHLGRVITASVFRLLTDHITPQAVSLISEVLIPKKTRGDDAGGVMIEGGNDDGDEDDDDDTDDNVSEDSSGDDEDEGTNDDNNNDDDEEEEEDMDEEEEDLEVDEQFRESVKQALGQAADTGDSGDEEEELSDMSDSEMFKLDDMLAEVFRQKKKAAGGKKVREEKKAELANFRLRVLDLVENMIKSNRCGDFLLDVLKPLLLLTMRTQSSENQALSSRAQALLNLIKSKTKGLKDTVHTSDEQKKFFQELLELAKKTSDPNHTQAVAMACYLVMNISSASQDDNVANVSSCLELFELTLSNVISKKQSKPHFSFFTSIIEINPVLFQSFSKNLLSGLKDENVKVYNKTLCCSILTSLCKKVDSRTDSEEGKNMKKWMSESAKILSEIVSSMERDTIKAMFVKELLQLMVALQGRQDILLESPFDKTVKIKLAHLKSKFNTDLRRLANKIISNIDRAQKMENGKNKSKKRKMSDHEESLPQKKSKQS